MAVTCVHVLSKFNMFHFKPDFTIKKTSPTTGSGWRWLEVGDKSNCYIIYSKKRIPENIQVQEKMSFSVDVKC